MIEMSTLGDIHYQMVNSEIELILEEDHDILIKNNNKVNEISDYFLVKRDDYVENRIELIWKDLSYSVKQFCLKEINGIPYKFIKGNKKIINNMCGKLSSGRLTAILGPNGAGKSSLIQCLGGRRLNGVSGHIFIECKKSKPTIRFAYYSQTDVLMEILTVEESLFYCSQLNLCQNKRKETQFCEHKNRNNSFISSPELKVNKHWHKVQKLINDLHLQNCSQTRVSGCSGGQRRRLSIALELIFSPTILLLDEPTSGLDSLSTLQCIQLLKKLSQNIENPMIVALVIHQPTASLLSYFDDSYVVSSTGQCIYEGPTIKIIEKLSCFGLHCPQFHNPSDFAIEIASGEHGWDAIEILADNHYKIFEDSFVKSDKSINMSKVIERTQRHNIKDQLCAVWPLTKRCFYINIKNPKQYLLQFFAVLLMLITVFFIHLDNKIGHHSACFERPSISYFKTLHIFDILNPVYSPYPNWAYLFYSMIFIVFVSMLPTLLTFPLEITNLRKERGNGWYSISSYYIAKTMSDLPQGIIFPVIYSLFSYIMTEQIMEMWRLLSFTAILVLLSLFSQGFGYFVSALFVDNVTASTIIGALINIPFLLFTGLLIKIQLIPIYLQPLTYISHFRLTFESLIVVMFGFGRCESVPRINISSLKEEFGGDIVPIVKCVYDYDSEHLDNIALLIQYLNDMFAKTSSFALHAFGYNEDSIYLNMSLMISYTILLRFIAYILLVWKMKVK